MVGATSRKAGGEMAISIAKRPNKVVNLMMGGFKATEEVSLKGGHPAVSAYYGSIM